MIKQKLIQFEKYIRRTNFNTYYAKKNMIYRFNEIFEEELKKEKKE